MIKKNQKHKRSWIVLLYLLEHDFISSVPQCHGTVVSCAGELWQVISRDFNTFQFSPSNNLFKIPKLKWLFKISKVIEYLLICLLELLSFSYPNWTFHHISSKSFNYGSELLNSDNPNWGVCWCGGKSLK